MAEYTLVIGNRNYSSWSLRAGLMARLAGIDFTEMVIPLDEPQTAAAIRRYSPAGRVPVLLHDGLAIWETTAIGEYLAERAPSAMLWPRDEAARAVARAVSAEMHAGFAALRSRHAMNMRARFPRRPADAEVALDIARIFDLWRDCRQRFATSADHDQGFLFGRPGIADAMYAPVVSRLVSYGFDLEPMAQLYCETVLGWPAMRDWMAAAAVEPWALPAYDP